MPSLTWGTGYLLVSVFVSGHNTVQFELQLPLFVCLKNMMDLYDALQNA